MADSSEIEKLLSESRKRWISFSLVCNLARVPTPSFSSRCPTCACFAFVHGRLSNWISFGRGLYFCSSRFALYHSNIFYSWKSPFLFLSLSFFLRCWSKQGIQHRYLQCIIFEYTANLDIALVPTLPGDHLSIGNNSSCSHFGPSDIRSSSHNSIELIFKTIQRDNINRFDLEWNGGEADVVIFTFKRSMNYELETKSG